MATNEELEQKAELLERIAEAKDALDDVPIREDLEDTLEILGRIAEGKKDYDELASNDELEDTANLLDRIVAGKEVYDEVLRTMSWRIQPISLIGSLKGRGYSTFCLITR